MPDRIFAEPRLAAIYDALDAERNDLDVYAELVDELDARSVLDIGCGTGTLACLLASRGLDVVALDPAGASLDVARSKPGSERVRWIEGMVADLPVLSVDVVTMTGNVAQVFLTDEDWSATLRSSYAALRPGGHLVFETRDPGQRAWVEWTAGRSQRRTDIPGVGAVESWVEVTEVVGDLVSFRWTFRFERDAVRLTSDSTLRFRSPDELDRSLAAAGFVVEQIRDAPDRPGLELVYVASRPGGGPSTRPQ